MKKSRESYLYFCAIHYYRSDLLFYGVVALLSIIRLGNNIYVQKYYRKNLETNLDTLEGGRYFLKKIELENEYYFALLLLQEKE